MGPHPLDSERLFMNRSESQDPAPQFLYIVMEAMEERLHQLLHKLCKGGEKCVRMRKM